MPNIDDVGRPEPPVAADEIATLLGFLDYQRATLEWKSRNLTDEGMRVSIAASTMTLAGLVKHMAWVEDHWFSHSLHGRERATPWNAVDWSADQNWEWNSALTETGDDVRALWSKAVEKSRRDVEEALKSAGLDQLAKRGWPNGESPSLRWIIVHMIEEYARHNGHADLLREAVDGETGE